MRSNVPPEGERERESADPFLPLGFDQRIPPSLSLPLIYPTLGIAKHLRQLCLRRFVPCVLPRGEGRREQTYFMPSFRIRVPFSALARLINFTRVLIMTRAQRSARIFSRIDRTSQRYFLPFFLLFFSLWLADRRWYRCSFRVGEENGRNFCFFFSVASSIPFRVIDRWRRGGGKVAQTRENRIPASERASTPPFKVTAFSSGNSACCKKLTADLALRHVSTTSCAEREVCAREGKRKKEGVGRKKGGQLLLSLQDQLKYPDGWLEKSGGREYEASQQKIK